MGWQKTDLAGGVQVTVSDVDDGWCMVMSPDDDRDASGSSVLDDEQCFKQEEDNPCDLTEEDDEEEEGGLAPASNERLLAQAASMDPLDKPGAAKAPKTKVKKKGKKKGKGRRRL